MSEYILEMKKISKKFSGVLALNDVDFRLKKGEVRALVGKNGAGKSTLIKILTGILQPTSGEIFVNEEKITNITSDKMHKMGIKAIYQENDLIPFFEVGESIMLNNEPTLRRVFLNQREMHEKAREILETKLEINIDTHKLIKELTISEKQLIQISRVLVKNPKIIIFDEPTAPLVKEEIDKLFNIINNLKKENISIIYISHRLEEIFKIADTVTVLKDGEKVIDSTLKNITKGELIQYMTGKKGGITVKNHAEKKESLGKTLLSVNKLETKKLKGITFELHKHEILAFFGSEGAGQEDLAKALFGLIPIRSGSIYLNETKITINNPSDSINRGMGYLPKERREESLIEDFSVQENITLPNINNYSILSFLNPKKERNISTEMVRSFSIVTPGIKTLVRYLSGGNQQKVGICKLLPLKLEVLVLNYPTMGIDVEAKNEIYDIVLGLARKGTAIILITPEYEEIKKLCDNVIVLRDGHIVKKLSTKNLEEHILFTYAIGTSNVSGGD